MGALSESFFLGGALGLGILDDFFSFGESVWNVRCFFFYFPTDSNDFGMSRCLSFRSPAGDQFCKCFGSKPRGGHENPQWLRGWFDGNPIAVNRWQIYTLCRFI